MKPSPGRRPSTPRLRKDIKHTPKSCAHIPASAASRLTSRPPQKDGSCAGQSGDFPVGDSCGSEPNQSQFAHTQSPKKSTTTAYFFSLGPVKRPTRSAGQVAHGVPLLQSLTQVCHRSMTRGARINRLHSSAKKQPKNNKMMVSTQTMANAKVVGPKNANDGAGARMMIFPRAPTPGARRRCFFFAYTSTGRGQQTIMMLTALWRSTAYLL